MHSTDTKQSIVSETDLKKFVAGFLDIQYLKSKTIRRLRDDEKQASTCMKKPEKCQVDHQSLESLRSKDGCCNEKEL